MHPAAVCAGAKQPVWTGLNFDKICMDRVVHRMRRMDVQSKSERRPARRCKKIRAVREKNSRTALWLRVILSHRTNFELFNHRTVPSYNCYVERFAIIQFTTFFEFLDWLLIVSLVGLIDEVSTFFPLEQLLFSLIFLILQRYGTSDADDIQIPFGSSMESKKCLFHTRFQSQPCIENVHCRRRLTGGHIFL